MRLGSGGTGYFTSRRPASCCLRIGQRASLREPSSGFLVFFLMCGENPGGNRVLSSAAPPLHVGIAIGYPIAGGFLRFKPFSCDSLGPP
jgi:hypothetical protein